MLTTTTGISAWSTRLSTIIDVASFSAATALAPIGGSLLFGPASREHAAGVLAGLRVATG